MMGEILEVLKKHETFLLSSHVNLDGDAIGSQLALHSLLSDLGKKVFIVNSEPVPSVYDFLLNTHLNPETVYDPPCHCDATGGIEVAIILDCGNLSRVGKELAPKIRPRKALINIDHHQSNEYFGTHNLVDPSACACAELIFHLMEYGSLEIEPYTAMCLYTAILTDTGCFKYANATAEAHRITARLIDAGISPDRVAELVYDVTSYQKAKLFGMVLDTLKLSPDGKLAYMLVTREMFSQTQTKSADTEGFIDYARSLKDIEIAILFRETEDSDIKVSLRSKGTLDVNRIAGMFNGGGHQSAAGCVVPGPLDRAIETILAAING